MSKKSKVIMLGIILVLISFCYILIFSREYTYTKKLNGITNIENIEIEIEQSKEIIDISKKEIKDGTLILKIKSKSTGKVFIDIHDKDENTISFIQIYSHNLGIITYEDFFGKSNGDIIIPISSSIFLTYILYLFIVSYRKNKKENLYQYKNVTYLGLIIFMLSLIFNQILSIFNYQGLIATINKVVDSVSFFSVITFPAAFIAFIFVTISNIKLLIKEGRSFRNILGIVMGLFLIFLTIIPEIINQILQKSTFINVHNERGIERFIVMLIETLDYSVVSYLECIFLGTIIIGIKSALHIPKFDKDFIVILGSQIRKDGTLTPLLKARANRAIKFRNLQMERANKDLIFVASGGKGSDEVISEGEAIKNYLVSQGISQDSIIVESKSKNTYENIKFSNNLMKKKLKNFKSAFSTTNYHVFRAGLIASKQNLCMEGIGSNTKQYFFINAFIREFIGTLYEEKKKHIIMFSLLTLVSLIMIGTLYISINM